MLNLTSNQRIANESNNEKSSIFFTLRPENILLNMPIILGVKEAFFYAIGLGIN